jgi:hypothetical protein
MIYYLKTSIFISIIFAIFELDAQTVPVNFGLPACFLGLVQRTNLSVFGDSRIAIFSANFNNEADISVPGVLGYLELARTENAKRILSDGATSPSGNHGFAGSTAKKESDQNMKIFCV